MVLLGCNQMTRGKTCEEFMKIKLLRIMNMCSSQSTVLFHQKDILLFCVRFLGLRMKGQQRLPLFSRLHHIQKLISIWQVLGRSSFTIYVIVYKQCSHQYYSIFYAISLIQSIHIIPCLIRLVLEENNRNQQLRNKAQLLPPLLSLPNNLNTEQYSITSFNRDTVTDCQLHNEDTMLKQVQMTQPDNQPVLVATFL